MNLSISTIIQINSVMLITLNLLMMSWIYLIFRSFSKKDNKNKELPSVSVIIPVFNRKEEIKSCLDSVFKVDYPKQKLEIIVVDDGSTDGTYDSLKKMPHINLFRQKHKGKSYALNFGLEKCKGEFILVLDSDTTIEKESLKNAVYKISDNVGAVSFVPKISNKKSFFTWFQNVEYHFNSIIRKGFNHLGKGGIYVWGCSTLYRTSIIRKVKFPNVLTEDLDLNIEIHKSGHRIVLSDDSFAYTKVPSNILDLFRQRIRWNLGALKVVRKNRSILFNPKYKELGKYLLPSTLYWYPYIFIIVPLIILQILYWLPYQLDSFLKVIWYFFTWFSLAGPFNTLFMIPEWGFSFSTLLGIMPAFFTTFLSILSLRYFKEKVGIRSIIGVFFLFPYFFLLNFSTIIATFMFLFKIKCKW